MNIEFRASHRVSLLMETMIGYIGEIGGGGAEFILGDTDEHVRWPEARIVPAKT